MRKLMLAGLLIMTAGCASRKDLEKAQSEATSLAAEKDSLLSEVLATSKLVSDVNSELATAKGLGVSPTTTSEGTTASSAAEDRQILLGKIREAVARNGWAVSSHLPTPLTFPIPEDRGMATLSPLGTVEYVEDLIRPGRVVAVAAEEGVGDMQLAATDAWEAGQLQVHPGRHDRRGEGDEGEEEILLRTFSSHGPAQAEAGHHVSVADGWPGFLHRRHDRTTRGSARLRPRAFVVRVSP